MARPPTTGPTATEIIRMRVTPKDKARLVRRAKALGETLTAFLLRVGLHRGDK